MTTVMTINGIQELCAAVKELGLKWYLQDGKIRDGLNRCPISALDMDRGGSLCFLNGAAFANALEMGLSENDAEAVLEAADRHPRHLPPWYGYCPRYASNRRALLDACELEEED